MTRTQAIADAQKKANLGNRIKQPQVVFRYIDEWSNGNAVKFDYTHQSLWDRRRHKQPIATIVTTVKPVTTSTD